MDPQVFYRTAELSMISAQRQKYVETVGHINVFRIRYLRTKFKIVPLVKRKKDKNIPI